MKCSRCGARYREDPSCGKTVHLSLPSRPLPEKLRLVVENARSGDQALDLEVERAGGAVHVFLHDDLIADLPAREAASWVAGFVRAARLGGWVWDKEG